MEDQLNLMGDDSPQGDHAIELQVEKTGRAAERFSQAAAGASGVRFS